MHWFNQLAIRERRALIIGVVTLGGILVYFMLWEPFVTARARLENIVAAQQRTIDWMNNAAEEVKQLRHQSLPIKTRKQSLLSLIDNSTRRGSLSKANKRIEPKGKSEVRVNFEKVSFTELVRWLGQLYNQHQVRVSTINIERQRISDTVKVRLTLKN
jgi:general secretion pathway protein M